LTKDAKHTPFQMAYRHSITRRLITDISSLNS